MLRIRQEQMDALGRYMVQCFEERLAAHLAQRWPARCKELGESALRGWIQGGMGRAARYGIKVELDVARFIELMFLLAPDFDSSGRTAWAGEILRRPRTEPGTKLDELHTRAGQSQRPGGGT